MRGWLVIVLKSVSIGWATLLLCEFPLAQPLLRWTAPVLGASWIATAHLALDCTALAVTGWVVGRFNRPSPLKGVLILAATFLFRDLTPVVDIDIPWLLRLAGDALRDTRYIGPLVTMTANQAIFIGCLLVGGLLSRPHTKPLSIAG